MKKKRLIELVGGFCLGFLVITLSIMLICGKAEAAADKPVVWKFATFVPAIGMDSVPPNWWAKEVEERTGGRLKIKFYWSEQLASAKEMLEAVQTGVADVVLSCSPYFPGKVPLSTIGFVPFTAPSRLDQLGIAWHYIAEHPLLVKEYDKWNARYLFSTLNGPFNLMSRKPVANIGDFKGLKVRAIGDQVKLLTLMGAVPVSLTAPDSYMALERGLCDSVAGCGEFWQYDFRIYEACKNGYYIDGVDLNTAVSQYLVNKDSYNALPADIKDILGKLNWEMAAIYQEVFSSPEVKNAYLNKFKSVGIKITQFPPEERNKMLPFAKVIWDEWRERNKEAGGSEFFDAYRKAVDRVLKEYPNGTYKERPLPSWVREVLPK
jgi:TRAP-type C4-dicarboxylate transport system substrate-binding protein